jgi:hypothetical protein
MVHSFGKIIADSVGWNGNIAWDIYLFYLPHVKWADTPPNPVNWMHQIKDEWATKSTYRTGVDWIRSLLLQWTTCSETDFLPISIRATFN